MESQFDKYKRVMDENCRLMAEHVAMPEAPTECQVRRWMQTRRRPKNILRKHPVISLLTSGALAASLMIFCSLLLMQNNPVSAEMVFTRMLDLCHEPFLLEFEHIQVGSNELNGKMLFEPGDREQGDIGRLYKEIRLKARPNRPDWPTLEQLQVFYRDPKLAWLIHKSFGVSPDEAQTTDYLYLFDDVSEKAIRPFMYLGPKVTAQTSGLRLIVSSGENDEVEYAIEDDMLDGTDRLIDYAMSFTEPDLLRESIAQIRPELTNVHVVRIDHQFSELRAEIGTFKPLLTGSKLVVLYDHRERMVHRVTFDQIDGRRGRLTLQVEAPGFDDTYASYDRWLTPRTVSRFWPFLDFDDLCERQFRQILIDFTNLDHVTKMLERLRDRADSVRQVPVSDQQLKIIADQFHFTTPGNESVRLELIWDSWRSRFVSAVLLGKSPQEGDIYITLSRISKSDKPQFQYSISRSAYDPKTERSYEVEILDTWPVSEHGTEQKP